LIILRHSELVARSLIQGLRSLIPPPSQHTITNIDDGDVGE
jgi:hypothetical protein